MGITSVGSKVIGSITNLKPMQACWNYFRKEPVKALANTTIASIALKDGIGCAMYVTQSLHNKKIPEDKRPFVAALDLTNGALMIVSQLAFFFGMKKISSTLFNKLFKSSFCQNVKKNVISQIRLNQKKAGEVVSRKTDLNKRFDKIEKTCSETFTTILDLAAATILAKRVVVPFIATPLADKVRKKLDLGGSKQDTSKNDAPVKPSSEPAMKGSAIGQNLDVVGTESNLIKRYVQKAS